MKLAILLLTFAPFSIAQPNPLANQVLNDLQARASQALTALQTRKPLSQPDLRRKLEHSLGLDRVSITDDLSAQLYLPPTSNERMPAVVIVEPHSDKSKVEQEVLPATLSRLGFLTIVVDTFPDHSRFDRMIDAILPQTLMQTHIRSALAYLRSRVDVDPKRIGLVADSLAGTIAAGLNSELSAIVLTDGAPDLQEELKVMRNLSTDDLPDSCFLVPGLLDYADSTKLLVALAPRPLLVFGPHSPILEELRQTYASQNASYSERNETYGSSDWRTTIYQWLRERLTTASSTNLSENDHPANVTRGRLPTTPSQPDAALQSQRVSQSLLDGLLAGEIPTLNLSILIPFKATQRIVIRTEPGIDIPLTVIRPDVNLGGAPPGILVAFSEDGRDSLTNDPFIAEAVRRRWTIWMVDPRGIGELKSTADAFVFAASTLLGENFAWRQAVDIAWIAKGAKQFPPYRVGIYAKGKLASLIAGYALTLAGSEQPVWAVIHDGPLNVEELAKLPPYATPIATQEFFAPRDVFMDTPSTALFFGEPAGDFNWR